MNGDPICGNDPGNHWDTTCQACSQARIAELEKVLREIRHNGAVRGIKWLVRMADKRLLAEAGES